MRTKGINIQISRGNLDTRIEQIPLNEGELFFQIKNNENLNDFPNIPYSEGALYIGQASLDKSSSAFTKIADARNLDALVNKGFLNSTILTTENPIFDFVSVGDFFIWEEDPNKSSNFSSLDRFIAGDILLVISASKDELNKTKSFIYKRLTTGLYSAKNLYYKSSIKSPLLEAANNTQDALEAVNLNSLHYKGIIKLPTDTNIQLEREVGSLYSTTTGITFPFKEKGVSKPWTSLAGDLALYQGEETQWIRIPTGSTAESLPIDMSGVDFHENFTDQHKKALKEASNVQDLLYLLSQSKAQIDEEGKVPVEQLPASILGALTYRGLWDPIKDINNFDQPEGQNSFPGLVYDESGNIIKEPLSGYYWIVDTNKVNIPYFDKTTTDNDGNIQRVIELNKGDWVVYTPIVDEVQENEVYKHRFELIDNSDKVSYLKFFLNTYSNKELVYLPTENPVIKQGAINLGASHKLGMWEDTNGKVQIGGIRLIDQNISKPAKQSYIPRYINTLLEENTIEPGSIIDTDEHVRVFNNLKVGSYLDPKTTSLWGNLEIKPQYTSSAVPATTSDIIIFQEANDKITLEKLTLSFPKFTDGSHVLMPRESSHVSAFLDSETYKKDFLLKRKIVDGKHVEFFTDSHLEEHLETSHLENHLENFITPNNLISRQLIIGDILNPEGIDDEGLLLDKRRSHFIMDQDQVGQNYHRLPLESGRLLTVEHFNELLTNGTPDYLPIYAPKDDRNDTVLVDSKLSMQLNSIYAFFKESIEIISSKEDTITEYRLITKDEKDLQIETDVIIGTNDKLQALTVTKGLIVGNSTSKLTSILPTREIFQDETTYFNPRTHEALPVKDTILELPPENGILLTHLSLINGGEYY